MSKNHIMGNLNVTRTGPEDQEAPVDVLLSHRSSSAPLVGGFGLPFKSVDSGTMLNTAPAMSAWVRYRAVTGSVPAWLFFPKASVRVPCTAAVAASATPVSFRSMTPLLNRPLVVNLPAVMVVRSQSGGSGDVISHRSCVRELDNCTVGCSGGALVAVASAACGGRSSAERRAAKAC